MQFADYLRDWRRRMWTWSATELGMIDGGHRLCPFWAATSYRPGGALPQERASPFAGYSFRQRAARGKGPK